jgi:hypothetical protein
MKEYELKVWEEAELHRKEMTEQEGLEEEEAKFRPAKSTNTK